MSNIVVKDFPNQVVKSFAPGNTNWNAFTDYPSGIPDNHRGVEMIMKSLNAAGTGDGSIFYYSGGQPSAPASGDAATVGLPISGSGQALTIPLRDTLYLKLGVSTDTIQILFCW